VTSPTEPGEPASSGGERPTTIDPRVVAVVVRVVAVMAVAQPSR